MNLSTDCLLLNQLFSVTKKKHGVVMGISKMFDRLEF